MKCSVMKWKKIKRNSNLPDECRVVLLRGIYNGYDGCITIATLVNDKWVTDAINSYIYSADAHSELVGFEPQEWCYL